MVLKHFLPNSYALFMKCIKEISILLKKMGFGADSSILSCENNALALTKTD